MGGCEDASRGADVVRGCLRLVFVVLHLVGGHPFELKHWRTLRSDDSQLALEGSTA